MSTPWAVFPCYSQHIIKRRFNSSKHIWHSVHTLMSFCGRCRNGSCVSEANTLVQSHNSALSDLVDSLQGTFVDSQILLVHSDDVLNEVEKDPIGYGFEDTKEACCGGGLFNGQIACGNSSYTLCKNVSYLPI